MSKMLQNDITETQKTNVTVINYSIISFSAQYIKFSKSINNII